MNEPVFLSILQECDAETDWGIEQKGLRWRRNHQKSENFGEIGNRLRRTEAEAKTDAEAETMKPFKRKIFERMGFRVWSTTIFN